MTCVLAGKKENFLKFLVEQKIVKLEVVEIFK